MVHVEAIQVPVVGVCIYFTKMKKEFYGGKLNTTNNQMELTAAIEGLKVLKEPLQSKIIYRF